MLRIHDAAARVPGIYRVNRRAVALATAIALACRQAHAEDVTIPVGMHVEERPSPSLFWTGLGLLAFGYVVPPIVFTGGALADAASRDSTEASSSRSWSRDAAPWLVPYAGPFVYLHTHPDESALWPVTFFAAQVIGTGLLVTSRFVTQRRLVRGEGVAHAPSVVPSVSRDGAALRIVGTF